jgi:hypothetical protein
MKAYHQPSPPTASYTPGSQVWDTSALYTALNSAGVSTPPPSSSDWYLDTGASTHMSSNPGILSPSELVPVSSFVTVGNGAKLPVTHAAHATNPTSSTPLHLNNVLVTPSLVTNLIFVKQLTRDNDVSIEFDPTGFSIKDLHTRMVKLRCEAVSTPPVTLSSSRMCSPSVTTSPRCRHQHCRCSTTTMTTLFHDDSSRP